MANLSSNPMSDLTSQLNSALSRDKRLMVFHLPLSLLMDKDVTASGEAMRLSQAKAVKKHQRLIV